jgi:hypothetical protein
MALSAATLCKKRNSNEHQFFLGARWILPAFTGKASDQRAGQVVRVLVVQTTRSINSSLCPFLISLAGDLRHIFPPCGRPKMLLIALMERVCKEVVMSSKVSLIQQKFPPAPFTVAEFQPFQATVEIKLPPQQGGQNGFVTVPKGKRLIIEYVSGEAFLPAGQKALFSVITSLAGDHTGTRHYLQSTTPGKFGAQEFFSAGQVVNLYADEGTTVMLRADRDSGSGEGIARMSLCGRLVNP